MSLIILSMLGYCKMQAPRLPSSQDLGIGSSPSLCTGTSPCWIHHHCGCRDQTLRCALCLGSRSGCMSWAVRMERIIFLGDITGTSRKTSQRLVLLKVSTDLPLASLPSSSWLGEAVHPVSVLSLSTFSPSELVLWALKLLFLLSFAKSISTEVVFKLFTAKMPVVHAVCESRCHMASHQMPAASHLQGPPL